MPTYDHTFPRGVALKPLHITDPLPRYNTVCNKQHSQRFIRPYGEFEIRLLKITPPTNENDYCRQLPDVTEPLMSYRELENFVNNKTHNPLTFSSWSTSLDDHQHKNFPMGSTNSNTSLPHLLQNYQRFSEATKNYTNKLNEAEINERFAEFHVHYFEQTILQRNRSNLMTHLDTTQLKIAQNNLFTHRQYIRIYAKILWRIHFIRQNILQQALTIWRIQKSIEYLNTSNSFATNDIYEHTLIGDTVYSTKIFRVLGDRDIEHRFTLPEVSKEQETYWTPSKLTALISGT